jgi:ABC-type transporter Mla maintaining outer membrane lipid asymmetry ATPase subunit MlaF
MRNVSVGSMRDVSSIVVEGVNWSVAPGDFWVIGGLQGSGKSDFLMLAGGMMAPASGTYCFLGEEMPIFEDHRLPERLRLGFVFEGGQLFNHLTVSENISLPLRYHRNWSLADAEAETRKMLELTELAPWADSTPSAMARNWQRRVGLARALMLRPDVLLLDNPLTGLDLRHRAWWLNLLEQLSRGHDWMEGRPMTLAITTNDLRMWRGRARQFAVLDNKRFTVLGSWEQVEAASDELVRELTAAAPQDE